MGREIVAISKSIRAITFTNAERKRLTERVFLRTELRDYITAFPKELITPPAGVKYGTLLHDFVPMVGIGINM